MSESATDWQHGKMKRGNCIGHIECRNENCIIQIHICGASVTECFSCMENERYVDSKLLLTLDKSCQWFQIVNEGIVRVFVPHEVKPLTRTASLSNLKTEGLQETHLPAIKCGNSCLSAIQSSRYHLSSSQVLASHFRRTSTRIVQRLNLAFKARAIHRA